MAVGVGHMGPDEPENPRVPGQWPFRELWQLPVKSRRKVRPGLPDLFFDEMIIVDQPFGGRRNSLAFGNSGAEFAVGRQQGRGIIVEPVDDGVDPGRVISDDLRFGQAARVLF